MGVIGELLPELASVAEAGGDPPGPEPYPEPYPEEAALVARSVDKRKREFAIGRWCARRAMSGLGVPPAPVLSGSRGEPAWPAGLVGAITHCDGYIAAAVACRTDILALGVDAEPAAPLPAGILGAVSLPEERDGLRRCADVHGGRVPWDRLLFSAKEAVYKAWFPLTGRPLGFEEAAVAFDPVGGTFTARLLVPGWRIGDLLLSGFQGRWAVRSGLLVTAIAVSADLGIDVATGPAEQGEPAAARPASGALWRRVGAGHHHPSPVGTRAPR